jgi:hypothetical protein
MSSWFDRGCTDVVRSTAGHLAWGALALLLAVGPSAAAPPAGPGESDAAPAFEGDVHEQGAINASPASFMVLPVNSAASCPVGARCHSRCEDGCFGCRTPIGVVLPLPGTVVERGTVVLRNGICGCRITYVCECVSGCAS